MEHNEERVLVLERPRGMPEFTIMRGTPDYPRPTLRLRFKRPDGSYAPLVHYFRQVEVAQLRELLDYFERQPSYRRQPRAAD
jgi:hypothetical protein